MELSFSIIVPSYNQPDYIGYTLQNLSDLKNKASQKGIRIEVLLFDSCSNEATQAKINEYKAVIDVLEVQKDKGQFDAINKGITKCTGTYWTWLNTDDLLDIDGFLKLTDVLKSNPRIDYIYGDVAYINEKNEVTKVYKAYDLSYDKLVKVDPAIFQPGSFFKTSFTNKIGVLESYACCFDYEYILRLMKHKAILHRCDFTVSKFRYYAHSKTGSNIVQFVKEQLVISEKYGRKWYHYLTSFSQLRLLKHFLFPRK